MPIKKYVGFKHFFLFGEQIWKNNKQTKKEEGMSVHVEKKKPSRAGGPKPIITTSTCFIGGATKRSHEDQESDQQQQPNEMCTSFVSLSRLARFFSCLLLMWLCREKYWAYIPRIVIDKIESSIIPYIPVAWKCRVFQKRRNLKYLKAGCFLDRYQRKSLDGKYSIFHFTALSIFSKGIIYLYILLSGKKTRRDN